MNPYASTPPLPQEEEARLFELIRSKKASPRERDRARHEVVTRTVWVARMVANRYRRSRIPHEDLLQQAVLGVARSVDSFDPNAGVRFSTYARFGAQTALNPYVFGNARMVGTGKHAQDRKILRHVQKTGEEDVEVLRKVGGVVSADRVRKLLASRQPDQSFDEDERCFAAERPSPEEEAIENERLERLRGAIRTARGMLGISRKPIYRDVLELRLLSPRPLKLDEIAARHGCARQNVCQVEVRIVRKLRQLMVALREPDRYREPSSAPRGAVRKAS